MALAQTTVTGKVCSQEDGEPVIGASVRIVETRLEQRLMSMVILLFLATTLRISLVKVGVPGLMRRTVLGDLVSMVVSTGMVLPVFLPARL